MTLEQVLNAADKRVTDEAQRERLKILAARVIHAFQTDRGTGIKSLLDQDFTNLRSRFEASAKKLRKETGSF